MRGGVSTEVLQKAAQDNPEILFLTPQIVAEDSPENLQPIKTDGPLDFTEILAICDIVISKVGYGILADCIANRAALLHPPRTGFAEDEISLRECPKYMRMMAINQDAFFAGNWTAAINTLRNQPAPAQSMDCSGDQKVARAILEQIGHG